MLPKEAIATLGSMARERASSSLHTARLRDGALVTVRAIRPSDVGPLRSAFEQLSPESRYLRFHAYLQQLPSEQWEYLTRVDGRDHVALIARDGPRIVGVARFVRSEDRAQCAEVAFVVADDYQRRGLGRVLRDALLREAGERGIHTFRAYVLPANVAIRRLLSEPPLELSSDQPGELEARLTSPCTRRTGSRTRS